MFNNNQKSQSSPQANGQIDKLYIRQQDGTTIQTAYTKHTKIRQILQKIYPDTQFQQSKIQLINKGRLINLNETIQQNALNSGQILHILKKQTNQSQRNCCTGYVSFQQKLYKIQYQNQDCLVIGFKENIQRQTKVSIQRQIVMYRGVVLDNQKSLREYSVQNQDLFTMERIDRNAVKKNSNLVNQNINIFTTKNRRGSDSVILSNQLINNENPVNNPTITINKLISSQINLNFDKLKPNKFKINSISNNKMSNNNNVLSPSMVYGPSSSQLSEDDPQTNFNIDLEQGEGQWNFVKSQQGSPLIKYVNNTKQMIKQAKQQSFQNSMKQFGNIFSPFPRNSSGEVNPLQFDLQKDQQNANESGDKPFFKSSKDSLDLQDAFNNLIAVGGEQEVVFCSSYYQKQEEKNQQNVIELQKKLSSKSHKQSELENVEQYLRSPKKQASKVSSIENIINLETSQPQNKNIQQIFNKIAKS